jgi:DNA repair protein RecO (recombination protein O)
MEATYNLKAIIIDRKPFREYDCRVTIYSVEEGKLNLVARGISKSDSKLRSHIEPFNYCRIMAVKGRQYDYIGSLTSENSFQPIKQEYKKVMSAGQALRIFNKMIEAGQKDEALFDLLFKYLNAFENRIDTEVLFDHFIVQLLLRLGYGMELYTCHKCGKGIIEEKNRFDLTKNSMLCQACSNRLPGELTIPLSVDSIKIARFMATTDIGGVHRLAVKKELKTEFRDLISKLVAYHFDLSIN